jgi:hypothetical protein
MCARSGSFLLAVALLSCCTPFFADTLDSLPPFVEGKEYRVQGSTLNEFRKELKDLRSSFEGYRRATVTELWAQRVLTALALTATTLALARR